jgi:hypothetical protein
MLRPSPPKDTDGSIRQNTCDSATPLAHVENVDATRRCRGLASSEWTNAASASSSQRAITTITASVIVGGGFGHRWNSVSRQSITRLSVTRLSNCTASVFEGLDTIVSRSALDHAVDRVKRSWGHSRSPDVRRVIQSINWNRSFRCLTDWLGGLASGPRSNNGGERTAGE